ERRRERRPGVPGPAARRARAAAQAAAPARLTNQGAPSVVTAAATLNVPSVIITVAPAAVVPVATKVPAAASPVFAGTLPSVIVQVEPASAAPATSEAMVRVPVVPQGYVPGTSGGAMLTPSAMPPDDRLSAPVIMTMSLVVLTVREPNTSVAVRRVPSC